MHVTPTTWLCVLLFVIVMVETPAEEEHFFKLDGFYGVSLTHLQLYALGWSLFAFSRTLQSKLEQVLSQLVPSHALLGNTKQQPKPARGSSGDQDALLPPSALALALAGPPPYESLKPTVDSSKHASLFWNGKQGPAHFTFLVRLLMLYSAVTMAAFFAFLHSRPQDALIVLPAILPVFDGTCPPASASARACACMRVCARRPSSGCRARHAALAAPLGSKASCVQRLRPCGLLTPRVETTQPAHYAYAYTCVCMCMRVRVLLTRSDAAPLQGAAADACDGDLD
jgi:hypothetical protein